MFALLIGLNILAALFLIGVVLLQSGKGADMGAAFGGSSSTVFGASGAGNLLTKLTAGSAAVFMLTSLALAVASSRQHSVFDATPEPTPISAPAPAAPADEAAGMASEGAGSPVTGSATLKLPVAEPASGQAASAGDLGPAGQAGSAGQAADTGAPAGKAPADAAPANAPAAGTEGP